MESPQSEVKVLKRTITEMGKSTTEWWFRIGEWPVKFWMATANIDLAIGDHVRITITKEPAPDVIPR